MRVNLAAARGLLAGWIVAVTVPLLIDAATIAAWTGSGLGARSRWTLALAEISGALLFAFQHTVAVGMVLLIGTFLVAAALHVHHGLWPSRLGIYALCVIVLARATQQASRESHAQTAI